MGRAQPWGRLPKPAGAETRAPATERGSYRLDAHDLEPRPAPVGMTDPTMRRGAGPGAELCGAWSVGGRPGGGGAGPDWTPPFPCELGGPRALLVRPFQPLLSSF